MPPRKSRLPIDWTAMTVRDLGMRSGERLFLHASVASKWIFVVVFYRLLIDPQRSRGDGSPIRHDRTI